MRPDVIEIAKAMRQDSNGEPVQVQIFDRDGRLVVEYTL